MTQTAELETPYPDPAHFELRGPIPRGVHVRRGAVVGLSALILFGLAAAVAIALQPRHTPHQEMLSQGVAAPRSEAADALAKAPADYAQAPVLGPPLTGWDMVKGRPSSPVMAPVAADLPVMGSEGQGGDALRPDYQIAPRAAGVADVRRSPVLVALGASTPVSSTRSGDASEAEPSATDVTSESERSQLSDDPNRQSQKAAFVTSGKSQDAINPHLLTPPSSRWIVSAGSIISASLITGFNSDLPGEVTAQVTEGVYDSPTGQTLLIPQGTRLIGTNDNVVSYGQKRALIVWRRLILPNGSSIAVDNWPAADKTGATGLTDQIDTHGWQLLKGVALSTLLGVGTELSYGSRDSDLARALRQSVETGSDRAGQQLVGKSLDVQPTIKVRPGWPVRVIVHQDLILTPWK